MQANWNAILVAGTLALVGMPGMGSAPAQAQSVGGTSRGAYPGYYYSPGGYSGGTYFSPGYYPITGSVGGRAGVGPYYGSRSVVRRTRPSVNYYDPTTGRTNLAIPLSKPWLRPLR